MRKILKNALVITLVTGLCLSIVGMVSADPSYEEITVAPTQPERQSDVTFSVDVTGDSIEEVWIKVQECTDPNDPLSYFCHTEYNVSMMKGEGDTWEVTTALVFPDSAEGHCWLVIKDNGTWYDYKNDDSTWTNFIVAEGDDGSDGNGGNGDTDDTGGTPGFELILILISIVVALSIYKRKRMK